MRGPVKPVRLRQYFWHRVLSASGAWNALWIGSLLGFSLGLSAESGAQEASARQLVQQVVDNQIAVDRNDHSRWMYRDTDKTPGKSTVKLIIQTAEATLSKTIEMNGRPLTPQQQQQDEARMESLVNDPAARAKQRKNGAHDDQQSTSLLKMLPNAFLWTYAGQSHGEITLHFKPNPGFQPPTYASRVFAAMAGDMVLDAKQKRLKALRGTLIQSVEFGWGLLGKLQQGGTFWVVRSEVAPGEWQITQTHVHIQGHALLFRTINEQEDDTTGDYHPTPPGTTLSQASAMLKNGTVAKELGIRTQ